MAAFATLTLQNNAAANVVYNPQAIDSEGVAQWGTTATVFDAREKATLSVRLPKNGSNVVRVTGKLSIPVMDTVDTTKKVSECLGSFELVLPKQATETQRLNLRKQLDTFIANAIVTSAVQSFEGIY